jgi:glutaredoxin-related protein
MEPFPSQVDFKRRCAHMKEEINKLTYEYDTWDLSIGMGRLKLLQFMMTCIYAQNVFDDHLKEG